MRTVWAVLVLGSVLGCAVGGGCSNDPRKAPDFRPQTLQDPGQVADPPGAHHSGPAKPKAPRP
jgi:hypothetical protein